MSTSYSPKIVTDGLVLALDAANRKSYAGSGATWNDLSGNNSSGTLENSPTFDSGNGGSIVFDGSNDNVNCGNSSTLNLTTALTINAWINPVGFGGSNIGRIVNKWTVSGGAGFALLLDNAGPIVNGVTYLVNGNQPTDQLQISNIISLNTWTNLTLTHTSTTAILYKNGSIVTSDAVPQPISFLSENFNIGNRADFTRAFNGKIANVQIYNKALSSNEVLQNFNATRNRFGI
jgi:hypothetical protein